MTEWDDTLLANSLKLDIEVDSGRYKTKKSKSKPVYIALTYFKDEVEDKKYMMEIFHNLVQVEEYFTARISQEGSATEVKQLSEEQEKNVTNGFKSLWNLFTIKEYADFEGGWVAIIEVDVK